METAEPQGGTWLSTTTDLVLGVIGFVVVLYPMISLGNEALGSPVGATTADLILFVLALVGANVVVSDYWSLGDLGEYLFVLIAAAFAWGVVGMVGVIVSGIELSGSNPVPQALLWAVAYLTATGVVFGTDVRIVR